MKYLEKNRSVELKAESILFLYVQDANGVPVPNKRVKIFAGPPPTGEPPYFVDDDPNNPNRRTDGNGKFQFVVAGGPPPNRLDFFVQVIGSDGTAESDPIHFPFPAGTGRWVTVTLAPEGAPSPGGGTGPDQPPPAPDLNLDPRLERDVGVTVNLANPAPGTKYWKLISAQYQDPDESGGNINIVMYVQDERGMPLPGQRVLQIYPGDRATGITDERGHFEFPMSGDSSFAPDRGEHGPYTAAVDGLPSDQVVGMGLPLRRHVQYILTWRRAVAGASAPPQPRMGTVHGKITNAPIGVMVILENAAQSLTAPIGIDGSYTFANVPAGAYELKLSNGQVIRSPLQLTGGENVVVDYVFVPPPIPGAVRGTIAGAHAGARLVLRSPERTMDALVAPDGTFSFNNVPPGTYTLDLTGVGIVRQNLVVEPGQTVTIEYPPPSQPRPTQKAFTHYLLFGPSKLPGTLTHLILALDYIVQFAPVVGFSVSEALAAEHVTIVGGFNAVSQADEQRLRDSGAQVVRLQAPDSYALEALFQQLLASGSPYPQR